MEIQRLSLSQRHSTIDGFEPGEPLSWMGEVYMKLNEHPGIILNAVHLKTGRLAMFGKSQLLSPIDLMCKEVE